MPLFLTERDIGSYEFMDDPNCDTGELFNTYRQFSTINAMISGWKRIYKKRIRPRADTNGRLSLLDIGFGGGDIPLRLAEWARQDRLDITITAIETDPRALQFVEELDIPANIHFKHCSSTELVNHGKRFDVVISNHLLHHLDEQSFKNLLSEARRLSKKMVLFNDIERSDIGYALFSVFSRPVFRSSFITHDGLTSIKRSFTFQELRGKVPESWSVERQFPFRLLVSYHHEE